MSVDIAVACTANPDLPTSLPSAHMWTSFTNSEPHWYQFDSGTWVIKISTISGWKNFAKMKHPTAQEAVALNVSIEPSQADESGYDFLEKVLTSLSTNYNAVPIE